MVCSPHQYILQGIAQYKPAYAPRQYQQAVYQVAGQPMYRGTEMPLITYRSTQYGALEYNALRTPQLYVPLRQSLPVEKSEDSRTASLPEMTRLEMTPALPKQDYGWFMYVPPPKEIREARAQKRATLSNLIQRELAKVEQARLGGQLCAA